MKWGIKQGTIKMIGEIGDLTKFKRDHILFNLLNKLMKRDQM